MCCSDDDERFENNKQSKTNSKESSKFGDVVLFGLSSFAAGSLLTIAVISVIHGRKQG